MKKLKYSLYFLSMVGVLGFTSCDENDVDQDYPLSGDKPVVSISATSVTMVESGEGSTATFNVTATKASTTTMKLKLEFLPEESTGSLDDVVIALDDSPIDFGSAGSLITIPANSLGTTFQISAVFDILPEGPETLKFRVIPVADLNSTVAEDSQIITLTINNSTSDSLVSIFDWNGDQEYLGNDNVYHLLSDFDFDLEIYDEMFNVVATSYTSSPEEIELTSGDIADGTYYIVPSLYSTLVVDPATGDPTTVPPMLPLNYAAKLIVAKPGVFMHEINLSDKWSYNVGGAEEGNPDAYVVAAYFVKTTVDGEAMYQLYDATNDALLAEGRMADLSAAFNNTKAKKAKAKKSLK